MKFTDQQIQHQQIIPSIFNMDSICNALKQALDESLDSNKILNQMKLYIASDSTVFKQDVIDLCMNFPSVASPSMSESSQTSNLNVNNGVFKPCILMVPVSLGDERFALPELNENFR